MHNPSHTIMTAADAPLSAVTKPTVSTRSGHECPTFGCRRGLAWSYAAQSLVHQSHAAFPALALGHGPTGGGAPVETASAGAGAAREGSDLSWRGDTPSNPTPP